MRHYRVRLRGEQRGQAQLANSWEETRNGTADRLRAWRRSWDLSSVILPGRSWRMSEARGLWGEQLLWVSEDILGDAE